MSESTKIMLDVKKSQPKVDTGDKVKLQPGTKTLKDSLNTDEKKRKG